jgi:hypothetical protein
MMHFFILPGINGFSRKWDEYLAVYPNRKPWSRYQREAASYSWWLLTYSDGQYQIPLDIHNGLAYPHCHPPTPRELETLPHIIMIADVD